jgi:hypothetical protein
VTVPETVAGFALPLGAVDGDVPHATTTPVAAIA